MEPPLVDVVVAGALHSGQGQLIDLSTIGQVLAASRTGDGWLMVTIAPSTGSSLWFVRENAAPQEVLSAVDEVVLAPDAGRVAWRDGARMFVAPVESGRLGTAASSTAPADGRIVHLAGAGVLLARDRTGVGTDGYAVWRPHRDTGAAPWVESVTAVYGLLPDGRTLVGQARVESAPRPCLALLDAERGLTPVKTVCTPRLSDEGIGAVSPDGHWLVANGVPERTDSTGPPDDAEERALVIDLTTAFEDPLVVAESDLPLAGEVAWIGADALVHAGRHGDLVRVTVQRVTAGEAPEVEHFPVPAAATGDRVVVVSGCATGVTLSAVPVMSCG